MKQAIQISLKDIKPYENDEMWSEKSIEYTQSFLSQQIVKVIAFDKDTDGVYNACIYTTKDDNFNARLVKNHFAKSVGIQ